MTLIEGVGEEVVEFVVVVVIIAVILVAWFSTSARPRRYRTVFVIGNPGNPNMLTRFVYRRRVAVREIPERPHPPTPEAEVQEEDPIPLQDIDATEDPVTTDHDNRIHFYRVDDVTESEAQEGEEADTESESAQVREMDSIVNAMEADVCNDCDFFNRSNDSQVTRRNINKSANPDNMDNKITTPVVTSDDDEANENRINIKIKYLNDTCKDVMGSLDELMKDFKLRHFSSELTSHLNVRLIYKGRLLADESTLSENGLHDHAVIHCLVHPQRQRPHPQHQVVSDEPIRTVTHHEVVREATGERTWDLENILMTLVSVALTVVWFLRCEYSNMFTASASVALFGLTVFYSVAIFGLYISDTFTFNPRPQQVVPNN